MRSFCFALALLLVSAVPSALPAADGYFVEDGKISLLKDGRVTPVDVEVVLSDDAKVLPDGTVVRAGGKRVRLTNGMMVDMSGNILIRNGVMMKDGKMMVLQDGDSSPMTREMSMSNGTRVTPGGDIITRMKEGDMMMMDGTITTAKGPKSKQGKF